MSMEYKIEIYQDIEKLWRLLIVASNGRIVADGAESYRTKYFCVKNANKLKEKLATAEIEYV